MNGIRATMGLVLVVEDFLLSGSNKISTELVFK